MTVRIKAACVAAVLTVGLLGATTAANACIVDVGFICGVKGGPPIPIQGDAPSPEVSTLLGFLVVAGTIAFIKRRRGDKAEAEDAAF